MKVFFDAFSEVDLWGKDLYEHLDEIYRKRSGYCVIFVSRHYARKPWTRHEQRSAQARELEDTSEYILPVRLDDAELPGFLPTTAYISAVDRTPEDLASLIVRKISPRNSKVSIGNAVEPHTASSGHGSDIERPKPVFFVALITATLLGVILLGVILSSLAYLISWLIAVTLTWALFDKAESLLSRESRRDLGQWLRNVRLRPAKSWREIFIELFDSIFSARHFSFRCFRVSSLMSCVCVAILTALWLSAIPEDDLDAFMRAHSFLEIFVLTAVIFALSILTNILPDYLSLLETRKIIEWAAKEVSLARFLLLICLDFVFTTVISLAAIVFTLFLLGIGPERWIAALVSGFALSQPEDFILSTGVFFYSAFFTSMWLYVYASGAYVIKFLGAVDLMRSYLDIEEKPLLSIGGLAVLIVTVIYAANPIASWLVGAIDQ